MTAPDGGSDNLILMTAYLMRELIRFDGSVPPKLKSAIVVFLGNCRVLCGLWLRRPGDYSQNSVDNLVGACYANALAAFQVWIRWQRYWSCFDVTAPTKVALNSNFYGRFIGLKAFIVASAGLKPWWIQRMLWIGSVYFTQWTTSGASDLLLLSLQMDAMEKYCPRTVARWRKKNPLYPLYVEYFGADFPLTLAMKGA